MRLTRRTFTAATIAAAAFPAQRGRAQQAGVTRSHGSSLTGPLKYPADFTHFEHVNPDAPKGGVARLGTRSNFDSFNPFIVKGNPATGVAGLVFDTLMARSLDEGSAEYGLLAEWIEYPDDYGWVAFRLRDEARWHDGAPVTPADVIFSLDTLKNKGQPFFRFYYNDVTGARDMGDNIVRFDFSVTNNRELPQIIGQLPVLPAHWWADREFEESGTERLLGSGPYRIGAFETGRFIEFERVEDYWAANLPVMRGQYNFDRVRYEVFLDAAAEFEGFKSGAFDFRQENSAKKWATQYDFPAIRDGRVLKDEFETEGPKSVQVFAMNLRRPKFQDIRVRQALTLAFDFEFTNRTVYFDQYARPHSYFEGTEDLMQSMAPPDAAELALLEPLRDQVPAEVFGAPWKAPETDGTGRVRRRMRQAARLLADAGYVVTDGVLVGPDGAPFTVEFLTPTSDQERVFNPFIKNLETLGVAGRMTLVDFPQYVRRVAQDPEFDYDIILSGVSNSESPGNEQREFWGSETADKVGGRNRSGVADPAVDTLIQKIIFAKDRAALAAASRALDRVLLWNYYTIPQLYAPTDRIAWWDRFGKPDPLPPRGAAFPTVWWWDESKGGPAE